MKKLVLVAAMLMASASAHAGSFNLNVEGHKIRVNVPRGCASLSCITVSAPTITDKFKDKDETSPRAGAATTAPAAAPAAQAATPSAPTAPTPGPPATAPQASTKVTVLSAPAPETKATYAPAPSASTPALTAPEVSAEPAPAPVATPAPAAVQVASAPPASLPAPAPAAVQAANTPIGLWMSEKKEGKIRIEDCNGNLCGYAVDAKTGANGAKVLINMKPRGDKWSGRIKDTRSGGVYDSTIALRGSDKLRVQGCAFGGMFCGGETWSRIQ